MSSLPRVDAAVVDAQLAFRALLRATARPGEPFELRVAGRTPAEAALLALFVCEVTYAVVGERGGETPLARLLAERTGARTAPVPIADFLVVLGGSSRGALLVAKRGSLEEPSEGATAVYVVGRLATGEPTFGASLGLLLSGPGVQTESALFVEGLARSEAQAIVQSRADYPLGVDVYLVDEEGLVVGLPRSTRVEEVVR